LLETLAKFFRSYYFGTFGQACYKSGQKEEIETKSNA